MERSARVPPRSLSFQSGKVCRGYVFLLSLSDSEDCPLVFEFCGDCSVVLKFISQPDDVLYLDAFFGMNLGRACMRSLFPPSFWR